MATAYILWDRKEKRVVESGGAPLIFSQSADATTHQTGRIKKHVAQTETANVYDVLTVTV